ncbi:NitT/TauT family transport system substrate-binding protein [Mesorhizobium sp. J18]|uniref:ABC transporter substrate-binding protein n=1 Tax=Mesorhizobium sp. J18 TaxID=935263 RepID=UPI00119B70C0|nr:ABC transporter substrate-binding protein [Mesorhizobium sp. J18]TWG91272.1 NitT/TauT family transport system substrate-binding protein [Mesorhizobium sp. J18]
MKFGYGIGAAFAAILASLATAQAQEPTKVAIGMSGWTGFAPLTLAKEAGLFEKNGLDVEIKMIPQKDRHLAIASGDIQCAATTVETFMIWNANGVAVKQLFQLDMSHGADGMVVRNDIEAIADLKGKTVAASAPGTSPYFVLAWMLNENGLSLDDVKIANLEPSAAAQSFIAGQNDAAMTYEPYLSAVRDNPDAGKIIATTIDYPVVMDSFGCTPDFISSNPEAVKALAKSYYDALDMIDTDKAKAYEIMGAGVKQSGEEFGKSASYLEWQDEEANEAFMAGGIEEFYAKAGPLLKDIGIIKEIPATADLVDTSWME